MDNFKQIIEFHESMFNELKKSSKTIILYFCIENWKPCREMELVLKEFQSIKYNDICIYKVDFSNKKLAKAFQIISLPTFIFLKNGEEKMRLTGSITKEQLDVILDLIK